MHADPRPNTANADGLTAASPTQMPVNASPDGGEFAARLHALRGQMQAHGLTVYLVPMADAYQSEYVPECDRRIEYLSGFSGSSAFLIVLKDQAIFFTDSRYTLQAKEQLPQTYFKIYDFAEKRISDWLKENIASADCVGFDAHLHTSDEVGRFSRAVAQAGGAWLAVTENLVDAIWQNRPPRPCAKVFVHEMQFAGKSFEDKKAGLIGQMRQDEVAAAILTDAASVAWLLNIRGGDLPHTPLALSFVLLHANGRVDWFIHPDKVPSDVLAVLGPSVTIWQESELASVLVRLVSGLKNCAQAVLPCAEPGYGTKIQADAEAAPFWIIEILREQGAEIFLREDYCALPRAIKNETEVKGMRLAHQMDGLALVRFMAWFEEKTARQKGPLLITELEVERQLHSFRAQNASFKGESFDTIAGAGAHGAIVHYRATEKSNRSVVDHSFFLLDSGGQYWEGTTDVTRTFAVGLVSDEMKDRYTRVLKGHIALAAIKFPSGLTGAELDVLARQALWEVGLDYGHGTGHGVGCYLGVHEGPQAISRRNNVALKPGMVVSNEPGFYENGAYGIRIENLQVVVELPQSANNGRAFYGFETLTLAPIDMRPILEDSLTQAEKNWLNAYHARVAAAHLPHLDSAAAAYLRKATRPIT